MRQRAFLPLILLIPASALCQSAATVEDGQARFGPDSRAPAFGLRVNPAPERAAPLSGNQSAPAPGATKEGWAAFGTMGPMRWAQPLSEDASMAWRFGGRVPGMPSASEAPGLPKRLNIGLQYRF